jgi:hypothetical protein
MGRRTVWTAAVAASTALAGCTGIPVRIDQNAQLLATVHCQSVGWAGGFKGDSPLRSSIANPLNEARLRDAIAANLQIARIPLLDVPETGTVAAPGQGAHCLIGYGIGMEHQIDTVYPAGWGYGAGYWGPGWGPGWGYGWGYGWGAPYVYHQSFITLDLYDAASRQPMWHASAEQNLNGLTGDQAIQHIRAAVDAIFLKFPR